jgi:hypothetical protein
VSRDSSLPRGTVHYKADRDRDRRREDHQGPRFEQLLFDRQVAQSNGHDRESCEKQEPTQDGLTPELHQRDRDWE